MADLQNLQLEHYIFVKEAFAYMLHKTHGVEVCQEKFQLFQPYVGDAILVLSYIFRKDYWQTFIRVRENLKEVNMFERYCRIVPVKKDERYFYNFLLRMSVIFELTVYCFDEGIDHFKTGLKCAADYTDIHFFESSGGWKRLQHLAQYIATLGRPLTLIMSKENLPLCEEITDFVAAVDAVRTKFAIEANLEMLDSEELTCLTKMRDSIESPVKEDKIGDKREEEEREKKEIAMDRLQTLIFYAAEDNTKKSNPELEMEIAIATYFRDCYLTLTLSGETPTFIETPDQDVSLKSEESSSSEDLSETQATKFADAHQHSKKDKLDKTLIAREECYNQSTFIVPQEYLYLKESDQSSKSKHLYCSKMRPPSIRKKLDGHLKKILDENIESQNCHIMPSGDILVCPPGSSLEVGKTLVIFAESSTDEEVDPDIDILMCLFKKIEIDSQIEEISYSLRSRRVAKKRLSGELDTQGTVIKEMTASTSETPSKITRRSLRKSDDTLLGELDTRGTVIKEMTASTSGTPSKVPRRSLRKSADTFPNEALYAKVLIQYYKKYFASFLYHYFKTDFSTVETDSQSANSSESNANSCEYVFAVSARLMAKRKVLLDNPEELKPVLGIRLYKTFQLDTLPLPVQRLLDSRIENQNYFAVADGIYGVGPEGPVTRENIWAILYSGDGKSNSLEFSREEAYEMPEILSSYEPVLSIFTPTASLFTENDRIILKLILDIGFQDAPFGSTKLLVTKQGAPI